MTLLTQIFLPLTLIALLGNFKFAVGKDQFTAIKALSYLSQYGYMENSTSNGALVDKSALKKAIADFQKFVGLKVNGRLDESTVKMMQKPRCGQRDKLEIKTRTKRFNHQGSKWDKSDLTYRVINYPNGWLPHQVKAEIARAFASWSKVINLQFTAKDIGDVDIEVGFYNGNHGDEVPFEGPGLTLAHAYFPNFGGDVHFDNAEKWTTTQAGVNLFQVAVHEIGHILGLLHSSEPTAIMAPIYIYRKHFKLQADDIQGIQKLYGARIDPKPPQYSLCEDLRVDAVFTDSNGISYIFRGDKYYRLAGIKDNKAKPKYIAKGWPGLPANIDAAFSFQFNTTYFFKGSKYWVFNNSKMADGYPKLISENFPGIPDNLDAATIWGKYNTVYFFKGHQFWIYDQFSKSISLDDPKEIINWNANLPNNLDAVWSTAFGFTYFFKGNTSYRFNNRTLETETFGLSSWFGCGKDVKRSKKKNKLIRKF